MLIQTLTYTLIAAFFLQKKIALRNVLLLVASYSFYLLVDKAFFGLLFAATVGTYLLAFPVYAFRSRWLLWFGVVTQILLLGYCKYRGFFSSGSSDIYVQLVLPLGISYYSFQAIGYLVDVYQHKIQPRKNPVPVALYLSLLFKIIAGPIEKAHAFLPKMEERHDVTWASLNRGVYLILSGALLKYTIADNVASIADAAFQNPDFAEATLPAILAYTLQIFADFSGYSLMAKGAAHLFGIELSWNFNRPYSAKNPTQFWKHWHISLSEWIRDYVYIPLGGNRKGEFRTYANALITMTLVGVWHGSGWMFALWGLYHGLLICGYKLAGKLPFSWQRLPLLQWFLFFVLIIFSWILFRSDSPQTAMRIVLHLFSGEMHGLVQVSALAVPVTVLQWIECKKNTRFILEKWPVMAQLLVYIAAIYTLIFFSSQDVHRFIYTQF